MYSNPIPRAEKLNNTGVNSSVIQKMAEEMALCGIDIHSLMVLKGGKVVCEGYSAPFTADTPHMMYSVSKSFLATAYGFALFEGKIKRDTKVLDVFPEYRKLLKDKRLEKLTIHHLLTMTAGKQSPLNGLKAKDKILSFLNSKWIFEPGDGWRYVNENYYVASAMLTRTLKMSITEYLTTRLYEPLEIEIPFWENIDGIEAGGWGLMLKTEDLARFILCYSQNGVYNGKKIIPSEWVAEATSKISDNRDVEKHADSMAGYGCGFWQCAGMKNTYRCEGMFCQYAICFKDFDACLIMTSNHSDLQETLDIIWEYMPKAFDNRFDEEAERCEIILPDQTAVKVKPRPKTEKAINGNVYKIRKCKFINFIGFPVGVFPMPVTFFATERGGNMDDISFVFGEKGCSFSWSEDGKYKNTLFLNMDGNAAYQKVKIGELNLEVRAYAYWENENTLVMKIRPLCAVAERIFKFEFNGNRIKMIPSSKPGTEEKAKKVGEKLKCILIGRFFHWWIDFLVPKVGRILNPIHYGVCKKVQTEK